MEGLQVQHNGLKKPDMQMARGWVDKMYYWYSTKDLPTVEFINPELYNNIFIQVS